MRTVLPLAAALCLSLPAPAQDAPPKTFAEYEEAHAFDCNGPLDKLPAPELKEHAGYTYELNGSTVKARRAGAKGKKAEVRLGVLAGIKDHEPETQEAVKEYLAEFAKQDVEAILVGGDTAGEPGEMEKIYGWLVEQAKVPMLAITGNMERGAAHNHAIKKARAGGGLHLFNLDLVRRFDGDGFDIVSLGGYYNKQYTYMPGACIYQQADVDAIVAAAKDADDPVVLLTHGPPKQDGKEAIDFVPDSGNVGDEKITEAIKAAKIRFGVHGHILEAAAKGTDLAGKPLPAGKLHKSLFLNPGSCNPLPWKMNAGGTGHGQAAVLTIKGDTARYEILKGKKRL